MGSPSCRLAVPLVPDQFSQKKKETLPNIEHCLCSGTVTKRYRMKLTVLLFLLSHLLECICFGLHKVDGSWVPLTPLSIPYRQPSSTSQHLQKIELGKDGRRIAVGLSNNSIAVYDLVSVPTTQSKDNHPAEWKFTAHVSGVSGVHFSLSPNGRFLASRHESIAKQVRVWEILDTDNNQQNSTTLEEKYTFSENVSRIGTFWCVADGQSVKLGEAGSKLYLAMSCETWLSDRGKVQVFVRDLSLPMNHGSAWDTFFPSLEGRNPGDLFGSALTIAEAPSHYSGYEFRLAIGSPGYNNHQGLVQIYIASYALSSGWEQMGEDLVGSRARERFGATLDMSSSSINDQPFLVVGSPGWKKKAEGSANLTQSGDFFRGDETLGSFGSGLVRLYHWRKSVFSIGAPRRWILVGKPMSGRDEGDQFGSSVMISQTGERIAIAASPFKNRYKNSSVTDNHKGYIGVYERESFHSWGKAVNDVITYDRIPCEQISQCFALNKYASMIMVSISNGTVGAHIDDKPFCSSVAVLNLQATDTNEVSSTPVNLDNLLVRQTCRKSDTLIADRNLCLEQSVFRGGKYQACSWQNISITPSPSTIPPTIYSASPTSTRISTIPSTSPSVSLSSPFSNIPSMWPQKQISFEPSMLTMHPSISDLPTLHSSLRGTTIETGEPSVIDEDKNVYPTPISVVPTPMDSEKPLGNRFSPRVAPIPRVGTSPSPTDSPLNQSKLDDRITNEDTSKELIVFGAVTSIVFLMVVFCGWFAKRFFRASCDAFIKHEASNGSVSFPC